VGGAGTHRRQPGQAWHPRTYPAIGLATARTAAGDLLESVARGEDPRSNRATADAPDGTLAASLAVYNALYVPTLKSKTARRVQRWLGLMVAAIGGGRLVHGIVRSELVAFTDRWAAKPGAHKSAIDAVKSFFTFLVERGTLEQSPAALIKRPATRTRDNVLSDDQIKVLWQASENVPPQYRFTVRMLLLTGCRKSEITRLRRDQINGASIKLPKESRKGEVKSHEIWLIDLMRAELARFPEDGRVHVLSDAETYGSGNAARDAIKVPFDWVLHDLRHTLRSRVAELGCPPHIARLLLGKATDDEYDHWTYAPQMREWWQRWSDHVASIVVAAA
jgi:integrase